MNCQSCFQQIDPKVCNCGEPVDTHNFDSGHATVPMGCCCGYDIFQPPPKHLIKYIRSLTRNQNTELCAFLETNSISLDAKTVSNIYKVEPKTDSKFRESGTIFICLNCGEIAELIIERSGIQPGTLDGPEVFWFDGALMCLTCGTEEPHSDSS